MKKGKRILSMMLSLLFIVYAIVFNMQAGMGLSAYASGELGFTSKNLWIGKKELVFGHERDYLFKWTASNKEVVFCAEPGKHMGKDVKATVREYGTDDENIPVSLDKKDFKRLALIVSWYKTSPSDISYAAAQIAIWSLLAGDFDNALQNAQNLKAHIRGDVVGKTRELLEYMADDESTLPKFMYKSAEEARKNPLRLELKDGKYEVRLNLSEHEALLSLAWKELENPGNFTVERDNSYMLIRYKGNKLRETALLKATLPGKYKKTIKNGGRIKVYTPKNLKDQLLVSAGSDVGNEVYMAFTLSPSRIPEKPELEIYRHEEDFEASYKLAVEKRDAETGKTLEGVGFDVYEAVGEENSFPGNMLEPDKMFPKPSVWQGYKKAGSLITDINGYGEFKERKSYKYDKIYAAHPEPEYLEVPALVTDEDGNDNSEEIASIEEENDKMRAEWERIVELCDEETDFHDNDIEVARQMMLDDRDATYEEFINLKYKYAVNESAPASGYIAHGIHNDDKAVEVILTASSESGKTPEILEESVDFENISESFDREENSYNDDRSLSLGEPQEDDEALVQAGQADRLLYTFLIENRRTEGEIHINKRDMELYKKDAQNSYGKTSGDSTLEGAVYGLFAAADIVHPDKKSGTVFKANELVAIASTDKNGDASFMAITEESETSKRVYNKAGTWIGHPLILGSYYVKEISRSEGFELSVNGANLKESNRAAKEGKIHLAAGKVTASSLSRRIDEFDGSFNDVNIKYYKTENGYDISINGYPEGMRLYKLTRKEKEGSQKVIKRIYLATKTDALGTEIFKRAEGGELKTDANGKSIEKGEDVNSPVSEILPLSYRALTYPSGNVIVSDEEKWASSKIDTHYLKTELNGVLKNMGYRQISDEAAVAWKEFTLEGESNEELGLKLIEEITRDDFFNAVRLVSVKKENGAYKFKVLYDYVLKNLSPKAVYDRKNNRVYVKKEFKLSKKSSPYHIWLPYESRNFNVDGAYVSVFPEKEIEAGLSENDEILDHIKEKYYPEYERYEEGEILKDAAGEPLVETEEKYEYEMQNQSHTEEILEEVFPVYDEKTGIYSLHAGNDTDWRNINEEKEQVYRLVTPEKKILIKGEEIDYADYLRQIKGAAVSVKASKIGIDEGSFVKYVDLSYPGKKSVFQDAGTRKEALIVLERVIKQAIRIGKDVSLSSFDSENTYKIHKDPFTVLYGAYKGKARKFVSGFKYKLYLVSDLEKAGLLQKKEDGAYDYKKLFYDPLKKSEYENMAIEWDKKDFDKDKDLTTLELYLGGGKDPYYAESVMLPYGKYVIVEQLPTKLINRHYEIDEPKEIELPFIPDIGSDNSISEDRENKDYIYFASYTPKELEEKFLIRFNEEDDVIHAHNNDGDFEIYKYGLKKDLFEKPYQNEEIAKRYKYAESENSGIKEKEYYKYLYNLNKEIIDYGAERENVPTMKGVSTATDGKYAKALVPYSVLEPRYGAVIDDEGNIGNRYSAARNGSFNFVGFAKENFENRLYSSKLRFEKTDALTGDNIIHENALFKIYAAKRDVAEKNGKIEGSGHVLFKTETVTGTRKELEERADVGDIEWDENLKTFKGKSIIPEYDEKEQIFFINEKGEKTGIFKAISTLMPVLKEDGSIKEEKVGYIETFTPLGAGVYVLVELEAPKGYQKSKPIAFEVYKDEVLYYGDGNKNVEVKAKRFQYVNPVASPGEKKYTDVARIKVNNIPSYLRIHKVEDGDEIIGDRNGLNPLSGVNDKGDLISYTVRGRKEYLLARKDVENIYFDSDKKEYAGEARKKLDEYSESMVKIGEREARSSSSYKPLYDIRTGNYTSYALHFDKYVQNARLALYEGLYIEKLPTGGYKNVEVHKDKGKVTSIKAVKSDVNRHFELGITKRSETPPFLPVYDTKEVNDEETQLLFYELDKVKTKKDESGELVLLDERGNKLCYLDENTGMVYTKDDYGRIIAYKAKNNEKVLANFIEIHDTGLRQSIYENINIKEDEQGLPLYYKSGNITKKPAVWISDDKPYTIRRLPFGAYILEETQAPYDSGYIKAFSMGLILSKSAYNQDFFYQNEFTKANFAKIDVSTKEEIPDARMRLYKAKKVNSHLEKQELYKEWISGYEYNDKGEIKLDASGNRIRTSKPHWIDHIPVGFYILEETEVPYKDGYVKREAAEVEIKESGAVQTNVMENDYTALEIKKYDSETNEVLDNQHKAVLNLYKADLDKDGKPIFEKKLIDGDEVSVPKTGERLVSWESDNGENVKAGGRKVTDEYGKTFIKYDYKRHKIEKLNKNANYFINENGYTRFEYLPVGYYVLTEEKAAKTYASALPRLIHIEDRGHLEKIHFESMPDVPLSIEVYKVSTGNEKPVKDAFLEIYKLDNKGKREQKPVYAFYTGADGMYTKKDKEEGLIPSGFEEGDLKPHKIKYIEEGEYELVESKTPFGFVKADSVKFTVKDSRKVQTIKMKDPIPKGELKIVKKDRNDPGKFLEGAEFEYRNKTLGTLIEVLATDENGRAKSSKSVDIGYVDKNGKFKPYIYEVKEKNAPKDYMLNTEVFEFCYEYKDENTKLLSISYDALNDVNQVKISKKSLSGKEELAGAKLRLYEKTGKKLVEEWISTKQEHYVKGLKAGKYVLEEVKTPDGNYVKSQNIEFEIKDNATEISHVEMFDDHSKIKISKTDGNTRALLAGAKLSLQDMKGNILYQWTSTDKAYEIEGLEAGDYLLQEDEAPAGYERAGYTVIKVENTLKEQNFSFANYRIKSSRKEKPEIKKEYISFKKLDMGFTPLYGAEFTFYRADKTVLTSAKSDENGILRIEKPSPGIYTFRETKAPENFYLSEEVFSFVVDEKGVVSGDYELKNLPKKRLKITKKDLKTGHLLEGAKIKLYTDKDEFIVELTSNSMGEFEFEAPYIGKYKFIETKAPEGYEKSNSVYEIDFNEKGEVRGDLIIYNSPEKFGRVVFAYNKKFRLIPHTGDKENIRLYIMLLSISLSLFAFLSFRRKKRKHFFIILIYLVSILCLPTRTYAGSKEVLEYRDDIQELKLDAYELSLDKKKEERTQTIGREIIFKGLEGDEKKLDLPKKVILPLTKVNKGKKEKTDVELYLKSVSRINEEWKNNFKAEMTVYDYDSKDFVFADKIFEKEGLLEKLRDDSADILKNLNLNAEYYKIDDISWKSNEYVKNDIVCRDAVLSGRKLNYDLKAEYELDISDMYDSPEDEESKGYQESRENIKESGAAKVEVKKKEEGFFTKMLKFFTKSKHLVILILLLFIMIIFAKILKKAFYKTE